MNTFNEHDDTSDEISARLNDLPGVEPPAGLVGTVMSAVRRHAEQNSAAQNNPLAVNYMRRGTTMAKKVLWSVAGVAAAALVVMRVAGYPPVEQGTEATVGAAQRYQAPQVAAADVKTENAEFQAFLQSDLFQQLVADKQAQEALKNEDFQRAIADVSIRQALSDVRIREAIADIRFAAVKSNARVELLREARVEALKQVRLDARNLAILDAALQASPALQAALAVPAVGQAIAHSSLATALARQDAALALSNQAVLSVYLRAAAGRLDAARTGAAVH